MTRRFALTALFLLAACTLIVCAAEDKDADAKEPEYLFVQTARSGTVKDGMLTLKQVSEQTLFFTDRPNRMAGHISTVHFLDNWATGKDSFKNDPPNATLSILDGKTMTNIVLELTNPVLTGHTVQYNINILEGTPIETFGAASLFFDLVMTGGGTGAGSTPFEFDLEPSEE
jgi:hypothetical protein